jgi:hypothetical protein
MMRRLAMARQGVRMSAPFHVLLRNAIQQRGLSLERLRFHLAERGIQIGLASLSDWQHGRSWPQQANSLRAIDALEDILGVPRQTLTSMLDVRPAPPFQPRQGLDEYSGPLGELLDTLPGSRAWDLEVLTTEHVVTVGVDRNPSTVLIRSLVRARRDGVDRVVVRYFAAPGGAIEHVAVRPLRNCHSGRLLRHKEGQVLLAELLFKQSLRTGETWIFEGQVLDPTARARTDFAHGFRHPEGNYLLEVRFHPRMLPSRVHGYLRSDLYTERHPLDDLPLSAHNTVHLAVADMSAGVVGITWSWPSSYR